MPDQPTQPDTLAKVITLLQKINHMNVISNGEYDHEEVIFLQNEAALMLMELRCMTEPSSQTNLDNSTIKDSLTVELEKHNDEQVSKAMHMWQQVCDMGLTPEQAIFKLSRTPVLSHDDWGDAYIDYVPFVHPRQSSAHASGKESE